MQAEEAKLLLGFPPHSHPSLSQVKAAYKTKVWDTHPDLFPPHQKFHAERRFKLISEAYSCLRLLGNFVTIVVWLFPHGPKQEDFCRASSYYEVVRTGGVPRAYGGRGNQALLRLPFLFIVLGTVALGGTNATRAYKREKEAHPSHNPFLP